jgi:hypothetical protein
VIYITTVVSVPPKLLGQRRESSRRLQLEISMNRQNPENSQSELLSNDELADVAGGMRICETKAYELFFNGLMSTAGPDGRQAIGRSIVRSMTH